MSHGERAPWLLVGGGGPTLPVPRRSAWAMMVPACVGGAMLLLLGVAARETLRPVREVEVVQAVWATPAELAGQPGRADDHAERVAAVDAGDIQPVVLRGSAAQAAGWVEADPYVVEASGLAEGVVREVLVLEGDSVQAGQVIARLVSEDAALGLRAAQADVAMAGAAVAIARADLAAAETEWEEPVDRDLAVAVARASVSRAEAELAQWPALVRAQRARLAEIAQRLERGRAALGSGGATEIEVLTLEREHEAQAAVLSAEEAREGTLRADLASATGELRAAERGAALRVRERRELEARRAAVVQAEASLRLAEVRSDEAALRLSRMEITTPIGGVVQQRYATPGTRIMLSSDDPRGAVVATLYDPARLQVRVDVPLADAGGIVVGQVCEVQVEVLPGTTLRGVVTRIGHEADIQKNTLEVKVRIVDPPAVLRPEMLARVKFLAGEVGQGGSAASAPGLSSQSSGTPASRLPDPHAHAAPRSAEHSDRSLVLVPAETVEIDGALSRVWAVRERRGVRGTARAEPVEVLGERDGLSIVRGGLRAGDLIVARHGGLTDGMLVRVRMAERGAGTEGRP